MHNGTSEKSTLAVHWRLIGVTVVSDLQLESTDCHLLRAPMSLKILRSQKKWSQETLAEISGLSLRTIQRVESGHRVGYSSLRALAEALDMDADALESDLYSMEDVMEKLDDYPTYVRLIFGTKNWNKVTRRSELVAMERFLGTMFAIFLLFWTMGLVWDLSASPYYMLQKIGEGGATWGYGSILQLFGAYLVSKQIGIGDRFDIWSRLDPSEPYSIFPGIRRKLCDF